MAKKIKNIIFCDPYLALEVLLHQKSATKESQRSWDVGDLPQEPKGALVHVAHMRHSGAWGAREGAGIDGRSSRDL